MSCAGCDECTTTANTWHLHVTVAPHHNWTSIDLALAIEQDVREQDIKIVAVTNMFRAHSIRDNRRLNYVELIPTKHLEKISEAEATACLFHMAHKLRNHGWRVTRLKLEGNTNLVAPGRALYHEGHLTILPENVPAAWGLGLAVSTTKKRTIATARHASIGALTSKLGSAQHIAVTPIRIEAATLDTNPGLDREWLYERN